MAHRVWCTLAVIAALLGAGRATAAQSEEAAVVQVVEEAAVVQVAEEAAVVQVVVDLFDAMRAGEGDALRALFFEGARLSRPAVDESGHVRIRDTSVDQFVESVVAASERNVLDERIYKPEVRIDGNLATVWVEYDLYVGDSFSHCGIDAFQLAHTGQAWLIFQIADTRRTEACPER